MVCAGTLIGGEWCVLESIDVLQMGPSLAASVAGRILADLGAAVTTVAVDESSGPGVSSPLRRFLDSNKMPSALALDADPDVLRSAIHASDLTIFGLAPGWLDALRLNPSALGGEETPLVYLTPFGLSGPKRDQQATDLTSTAASGIARLLAGPVENPESSAPLRAVGEQSAYIAGITAACAAMQALLHRQRSGAGDVIDVSIQEAMACMAVRELAQAGAGRGDTPRRRVADGGGATVTILPTRDGHVAISPRERHQWAAWLEVMGAPEWADDARFAEHAARVENWDALHDLLSDWSRDRDKESIAELAQAAHVPSFPLRRPDEHLNSRQLQGRGFFEIASLDHGEVRVPSQPFGLTTRTGEPTQLPSASLPLDGIRVLDLSWVIAGPTCTRYLAAMGADVIKVEAPGRPDPGRSSELHSVLGQNKRGIVLDLKQPEAVRLALDLAARSDLVVENFATGVLDRLGIGEEALRRVNPNLILVSASGVGRTGPEADRVAYGTLLQCYSGFAGLNGHPGASPRVGMAWLDPMCGLMLALIATAAVFDRQTTGRVHRVDFSMVEAMLWTMAGPLIRAQLGFPVEARGNASEAYVPHGIYPAQGDDAWLSLAVRDEAEWVALGKIVPGLDALGVLDAASRRERAVAIDEILAGWTRQRSAVDGAILLQAAGIPAAEVASASSLVEDAHLDARGFWRRTAAGVLPDLPWRTTLPVPAGPAPELGADTDAVLAEVLGLEAGALARLRESGVFG